MDDRSAAPRVDAALVARALGADGRIAFGELVRRHQGAVRAQLQRLTRGDRAWADDLAQETFLHAWRKLGQFRGEARFSTWLYRVAYTTFLRATRARGNEPVAGASEDLGAPDQLRGVVLRKDLQAALETLAEPECRAIMLCYDFDLTHEEAAYVLGVPVGTVKSHISRGKAKLRERLGAWRDSATG